MHLNFIKSSHKKRSFLSAIFVGAMSTTLFAGFVFAVGSLSEGWRATPGTALSVDTTPIGGDCKIITPPNDGKDRFVPTKTLAEWNAFKLAVGGLGIATSNCASPIQQFAIGNNPYGLAFDPSTNSIWVGSAYLNNVKKFRASDGVLLGTYASVNSPQDLLFDPSTNSIWAANSSNLSKFRASDGNMTGPFSGVVQPFSLAFDPNTNSIWTANLTNSTVTKHTASSGVLNKTFTFPESPNFPTYLAYDSFTNSMWLSSSNLSTLRKYRISDGAILGNFASGVKPSKIIFDPSTNSIWSLNPTSPDPTSGSGTITKIRASDGQFIQSYTAGVWPHAIAFDPSTNSIWVANERDKNLMKFRALDGQLLRTYDVGVTPFAVVYDPYTNSIWFTSDDGIGAAFLNKLQLDPPPYSASFAVEENGLESLAFDSSTNSIWATIPYDPALSGIPSRIRKYRASDGKVLGTFTTAGASPSDIVFDSSTNSIWVPNYYTNNIRKYRASDGADQGTFATGNLPTSAVFDSSTNSIWVVGSGSGNIKKFRASDNVNTLTIPSAKPSPYYVVFDSSTNSIWVGSDTGAGGTAGYISKYRASDGLYINSYALDGYMGRLAFDPITNSIWAVVPSGSFSITDKIKKFRASDGLLLDTYDSGGSVNDIKFDQTTNSILVAIYSPIRAIKSFKPSNGSVLNTYNLDTFSPTRIVRDTSTNSIWYSAIFTPAFSYTLNKLKF